MPQDRVGEIHNAHARVLLIDSFNIVPLLAQTTSYLRLGLVIGTSLQSFHRVYPLNGDLSSVPNV